jgi:hypothetical protein
VLTHQYSDDATWRQTRALIPAANNSPWMVAEYNTGFLRTGLDYWNVYVYLADGTWYQNHKSECNCPRFKEQIHSRLTTVLGLGTTLATAGEVLDHDSETPAQTP